MTTPLVPGSRRTRNCPFANRRSFGALLLRIAVSERSARWQRPSRFERQDARSRLLDTCAERRIPTRDGEQMSVDGRIRAAPGEKHQVRAGANRALGDGRDRARRQRGSRLQRVGHDDTTKAELLTKYAVDDRARLRRDACTIERRVARVPDHHERDSRRDRGSKREEIDVLQLRARPSDRHDRPVRRCGGGAEARKVLGSRRDAARSPTANRLTYRLADDPRIPRECTRRDRRIPHAGNVYDRSQAGGDTERAQSTSRGLCVGTHRSRGDLFRRGARGSDPWHPPNQASLLIDGNNGTPSGAAQRQRERSQLHRTDDVLAEQDDAGCPALVQRIAHIWRNGRSFEAQNDELADLLL